MESLQKQIDDTNASVKASHLAWMQQQMKIKDEQITGYLEIMQLMASRISERDKQISELQVFAKQLLQRIEELTKNNDAV